jgi:hypothetical protein
LPSAIKGFLDDSVVISTNSMGIICVCRSIEDEGSKGGADLFHREGKSKQGHLRANQSRSPGTNNQHRHHPPRIGGAKHTTET